MIVGLNKMYQEKNITVAQGDLVQVAALRQYWRDLVERKFSFIEKVGREHLGPYQIAEVDKYLVMLTGEIREVEARAHMLLFGGEVLKDEPPLSLSKLFANTVFVEVEKKVAEPLPKEVEKILKARRGHFKYKLNAMEVGDSKYIPRPYRTVLSRIWTYENKNKGVKFRMEKKSVEGLIGYIITRIK